MSSTDITPTEARHQERSRAEWLYLIKVLLIGALFMGAFISWAIAVIGGFFYISTLIHASSPASQAIGFSAAVIPAILSVTCAAAVYIYGVQSFVRGAFSAKQDIRLERLPFLNLSKEDQERMGSARRLFSICLRAPLFLLISEPYFLIPPTRR